MAPGSEPSLPRSHSLRRRLTAALGVLGVAVLASAWAAATTQRVVHAQHDEVLRAERGIEGALRLTNAVRDAYAHQAHMILLDDPSHVDHTAEVFGVARAAVNVCQESLPTDERAALNSIAVELGAMERNFWSSVVKNVPADSDAKRRALSIAHDEALRRVDSAQVLVDGLAARLTARVDDARRRAEAAEAALMQRLLLIVCAALATATGVGLYLQRAIAGPVRALEEGTRRLAQGDLQARVVVRGRDELSILALRFNDMAARLDERERRLLAAERLAGVGRIAAGVAHEVNNPLAVILGLARLIERGQGDAAKDARAIAHEVQRTQRITQGLLDLARPQRLHESPVDLPALIHDEAQRLPAGAAPLLVNVRDASSGAVTLHADDDKLRQVVANLLQNARDAGATRVDIDLAADADAVVARFRDDGSGLDAAVRARLFEPFHTTRDKGTGLGLAVSRAIARAHGGDLTCDDSDRGAVFVLRLPLVPPPLAEPTPERP